MMRKFVCYLDVFIKFIKLTSSILCISRYQMFRDIERVAKFMLHARNNELCAISVHSSSFRYLATKSLPRALSIVSKKKEIRRLNQSRD